MQVTGNSSKLFRRKVVIILILSLSLLLLLLSPPPFASLPIIIIIKTTTSPVATTTSSSSTLLLEVAGSSSELKLVKDIAENRDIGVYSIQLEPSKLAYNTNDSILITASIMNYAQTNLTVGFDVTCVIRQNSTATIVYYNQTYVPLSESTPLEAGSWLFVDFPVWNDTRDEDTYTITITTLLTDDAYPDNNISNLTIEVYDWHDIAVSIITPVDGDIINTDTEVNISCMIYNNGTFTEFGIKVQSEVINTADGETVYYSEKFISDLNASEGYELTFTPSWLTTTTGIYKIRITVFTPDDQYPNNNISEIIVEVADILDITPIGLEYIPAQSTYDSTTTVCIIAVIKNEGNLPAINFTVSCTIYSVANGSVVYHQNVSGVVVDGTYGSTNTTSWMWLTPVVYSEQTFELQVITHLEGDINPDNDLITGYIIIDPVLDLGIIKITTVPELTEPLKPYTEVTIGVTVRNYGGVPHKDFKLECQISSPTGEVVSEFTRIGNEIDAYAELNIEFDENWTTPSVAGNYIIEVKVILADDENLANNELSVTATVMVFIDVGIAEVIRPVDNGTYDLGILTFKAVAKNFGTLIAYNVKLEQMLTPANNPEVILYNDIILVAEFPVGETITMEFEYDFSSEEKIGNYTVRFKVWSEIDQDRSNDEVIVNFSIGIFNRIPIAKISSPLPNSKYIVSEPILFDGSNSYDPDDDLNGNGKIDGNEQNNLSFYWESSIDGAIGYTPKFQTVALSKGAHTITLFVTDGFWNVSTTVGIIVYGSDTFIIRAEFIEVEVCYSSEEETLGGNIQTTTLPAPAPSGYLSIGLFYLISILPEHWAWLNISINYRGAADKTLLSQVDLTSLKIWCLPKGSDRWLPTTIGGVLTTTATVWGKLYRQQLTTTPTTATATTTTKSSSTRAVVADDDGGTLLGVVGVFGLPLPTETATIQGWVTDTLTALPIKAVNISLVELNFGTETDTDGYYKFENIPLGIYTLRASKRNYYVAERTDIRLEAPNVVVTINFSLQPSSVGNVEGKVVDKHTQKPLEGATVLVEDTGQVVTTDAEGRYELRNIVTGAHRITASHPGYYNSTVKIDLLPGDRLNIDFELTPLNRPPILCNGTVIPTKGNINTKFRFTVTYIDPDNDAPEYVMVIIDLKYQFKMGKIGGKSYQEGIRYAYETKLSPGRHTCKFIAKDQKGATAIIVDNITQIEITVVAPPEQPPTAIEQLLKLEGETLLIVLSIIIIVGCCCGSAIGLVVIRRIKRKRKAMEEAEATKVKMCTICGASLRVDATHCDRCGRPVKKPPIEPHVAIHCPSCGKANPRTARICNWCRHELPQQVIIRRPPPRYPVRRRLPSTPPPEKEEAKKEIPKKEEEEIEKKEKKKVKKVEKEKIKLEEKEKKKIVKEKKEIPKVKKEKEKKPEEKKIIPPLSPPPPTQPPLPPPKKVVPEELVTCLSCGREISMDKRNCPFCGESLW